jgi:LysM repeat protein
MTLKAAAISLTALFLSFGLEAAAADRSADYEQVRRIAARDPKVRAAYEAADRKLAARIVEIDPTLKGYTPGRSQPERRANVAPAAKAQPGRKAVPVPAVRKSITHVVAKGETLGGIAGRYGVTVATLKSANGIKDERKLAAGQKIAIPGGKSQPSAARPASKPPEKKKSDSFWSQFGI